jgi:hypothetical protein
MNWEHIRPVLDEALVSLGAQVARHCRYFLPEAVTFA